MSEERRERGIKEWLLKSPGLHGGRAHTEGPFHVLTAGVERSLKGVEDYLTVYLGTPGRPVPFGGREVELATLDGWLADPDRPYLLLVADAGRGKSALLAQWAREIAESQRGRVVLAPISIRFDTNLRQQTLGLLELPVVTAQCADLPAPGGGLVADLGAASNAA